MWSDYFYTLLCIDDGIKMINLTFLFAFIVSIVLFLVSLNILGSNYERTFNKNMVFECGIIRDKLSRKSFSLRFFLFIILFLVFEIEIILFIPCRILQDFILLDIVNLLIVIIFLLGGGLFYEWIQGALSW